MENSLKHTYYVGGMSCSGCVSAVTQKLSSLKGVISVSVDLGKKETEICTIEEMDTETFRQAFGNTRYTISEFID